MKTPLRYSAGAALAVFFLVLSSCYPFMGSLPSGAAAGPAIQHVPYSGSFSYSVDTGTTPRDVYFVFTNPDQNIDLSSAPAVASGSITVNGKSLPAPVPQALPAFASAPATMNERVAEFNRNPFANIGSSGIARPQATLIYGQDASIDAAGQHQDFVMEIDASGNPTATVAATCQDVRTVDLGDGRTRSLSIWLADTTFKPGASSQVTAVENQLLKTTVNASDIYHWDTAVVGEPWAHMSSPYYIDWDANQTITILIADLNPSYPASSYTVGYFYGKDNFKASYLPGSNQRIMFYIDATLLGGFYGDYTNDIYSTLAHEFQHMIQFYQKQVVYGLQNGAETWINEMCSMIMEDLVADKQAVEGPRGVTPPTDGTAGSPGINIGRIPDFNQFSFSPLVRIATPTVPFDLVDYSVSYAFGAWLARNYGGAELLRRIVQSPQTDASAVVNAVKAATGNANETFAGLLERWAAAVLLSNTTSAPSGYRYNLGTWFTSTIGGQSFNLGSIDFYNYTPPLTVYTSTGNLPAAPHSSNIYFKAAAALSGARSWNIKLPSGVLMNVVIR